MNYTRIAKIGLFTLAALLVLSGLVMFLWNWLLPDLVGAGELSTLQAMGLLILCKILFGDSDSKQRQREHKKDGDWRKKLKSRVNKMSPNERTAFLNALRTSGEENP